MLNSVFATTTAAGATGIGAMGTIIYVLFIVLLFWFLLIRPQRKQKKEREALMSSLNVGDEIFTAGGILGSITRIKEHTVWVRISEKCEIELLKSSIGGKHNSNMVPEPQIDKNESKPEEEK